MAGENIMNEDSKGESSCGSPFCKHGCRPEEGLTGPADPVALWAEARERAGINEGAGTPKDMMPKVLEQYEVLVEERRDGYSFEDGKTQVRDTQSEAPHLRVVEDAPDIGSFVINSEAS